MHPPPPRPSLFPYTTLFRSEVGCGAGTLTVELAERAGLVVAVDIDAACVRATRAAVGEQPHVRVVRADARALDPAEDRKSTRLNSSHRCISYAVFCLKKKIP